MRAQSVSEVTIISTGGTFNKIYNPLKGVLEVDPHARALETISKKWLCTLHTLSVVNKDSLEMDDDDRQKILEAIRNSSEEMILVIHGTDTMELTARYLFERLGVEKRVLLTGAMVPYSIDPVEATANLAMGLGYLLSSHERGVFLSMNGWVGPWESLGKNRSEGRFQPSEAL